VKFEVVAEVFHHVGRKVPRQFAKEIQHIFLPRDEFTCGHRHFAEHMIDCDLSQLGTACGKVFLCRCREKRSCSRGLLAAETNGVQRALQEQVKGCAEIKVEGIDAGQVGQGRNRARGTAPAGCGKAGSILDCFAFAASQKTFAGYVVKHRHLSKP
jgi:hypothetical protein